MATIAKIKMNPQVALAAMAEHQTMSTSAAQDRFAIAQEITKDQPTGLSAIPKQSNEGTGVATTMGGNGLDLNLVRVGDIVSVPLHLVDANPLSPRRIYTTEEVDRIAKTMPAGQDVAAHGYIEDGRVKLIDGGTRFRAAKITDIGHLDVKIEEPPKDKLDLFIRARMLNEQRSETTALDFALSLKTLLDLGVVKTQRELIEKVEGPKGGRMSESSVSEYLRVARMPETVQRRMSEYAETSSAIALYAVSELFNKEMEAEELENKKQIAYDIIDEIKRKQLNRHQIVALVRSKISGPSQRERSIVQQIEFVGRKGQIRTFAKKGKIELELSGLDESQMNKIRAAMIKTLDDLKAEDQTNPGLTHR